MSETKIQEILKKRFIGGILNTIVFILLDILVIHFTGKLDLITLILFFVICFGVIPYISSGYTLGGYFLKLKIVDIDGGKINIIKHLLRVIRAIFILGV